MLPGAMLLQAQTPKSFGVKVFDHSLYAYISTSNFGPLRFTCEKAKSEDMTTGSIRAPFPRVDISPATLRGPYVAVICTESSLSISLVQPQAMSPLSPLFYSLAEYIHGHIKHMSFRNTTSTYLCTLPAKHNTTQPEGRLAMGVLESVPQTRRVASRTLPFPRAQHHVRRPHRPARRPAHPSLSAQREAGRATLPSFFQPSLSRCVPADARGTARSAAGGTEAR